MQKRDCLAMPGHGYFIIKFLLVMKISVMIVLLTAFQALAIDGSSQKRIDLVMKNGSITSILKEIEKRYAYRFFYSDSVALNRQKMDVYASHATIDYVMQRLLQHTSFSYKKMSKGLVVIIGHEDMLINFPVKGRVTDAHGVPLPGVSIIEKGTENGTTTKEDGSFTIEVSDEDAILTISAVGYVSRELSVKNDRYADVVLANEDNKMNEVVVVGYSTQKKVNLTGAVSTVSGKELDARPVTKVAQALQGLVPGLNITQSGALGGSLENNPGINIRGIGTIGAGSRGGPLILIDGMEGDINAISAQDIDNISVLKDAAASSIYGSRAPFGVILITTKSGKDGRARINAGVNVRASSPVLLPEMMDAYTFTNYFNDARLNSGQGIYFSEERMQRIKDYMDGKITTTIIPRPGQTDIWGDGYFEGNDNIDWYKAIYRSSAPSQEYSINASGGKEKVTYYVGGNYLDQTGLMRFGRDHFRRYNSTGKINGKLSDKASLAYSMRFSREEFERPSYMTNTLNQNIARQGWPVLPLYDNNGYLYDAPSPALGLRDGGRGARQTDGLTQQLKLTVEPVKDWKLMADLNYNTINMFYHWDLQKTYNHNVKGEPYPALRNSEVHEEGRRANYLSTNLYTEYSRAIQEHHFKVLLGVQSELMKTHNLMAERQGIIIPSLPVIDATSGNDPNGNPVAPAVAGSDQHWSTLGYFGRINYNFNERYLLEANLRYDGSSRFRAATRWKYAPSVSAGWNLDKEAFWKGLLPYVSAFKIRGSYGELSNQNTNNWYPTYATMPVGNANGSWLVNGIRPNTASAPLLITDYLSWEQVRSWNIGADLGFLSNRLTATLELYTRYTENMTGPAPQLPVILGTPVPLANNTNLKSSGVELDMGWKDRLRNGLGYSLRVLLADARTVVTKYPNPTGDLGTYLEGRTVGEIWGYKTIGIAKTQEEMDAHLTALPNGGQNALGSNWKAGDLMFEDVNGDGKINSGSNTLTDDGDLVVIGNSSPRYSSSLDLGADFKGIDLRVFFQGVLKRDYFNNNFYFWGASSSIYSSVGLKPQADYFRNDPDHPLGLNLDAYYPRPLLSTKNQRVQTRYLQDASYIRLKNLQIGYSLPQGITRKIGVQRVRFYFSGENIWTMTKMAAMFDPETIDGGWNGSVYPLSKVYSFGLNVTL